MKQKKNQLQIKTYEIDYDFILKNYTDKSLWDTKWNILKFKNYNFYLYLYNLNVRSKRITFEIKLDSDLDIWNRSVGRQIEYSINSMTIKDLKNLIKEKMIRLVDDLEQAYIEAKDNTYKYINDSRSEERQRLEEIAKEFLDENNVTNSEIRDVYIDYYVDNNEKIWEKLRDYKEQIKYTYLTELYLILANIYEDVGLKQTIRNNQNNDISSIEQEVIEYMEYLETEECTEEMQEKLESI